MVAVSVGSRGYCSQERATAKICVCKFLQFRAIAQREVGELSSVLVDDGRCDVSTLLVDDGRCDDSPLVVYGGLWAAICSAQSVFVRAPD